MFSIPITLGKKQHDHSALSLLLSSLHSLYYNRYAYRSDDWPVNSQDSRWRKVEAGRNEIEIAGLHPNQKYAVKVLAKYASAEDTIENWSGKEVAAETGMCSSSFVQYTSILA